MILSNQVKCHKCGDTPFSAHRHDFRSCKCGSISVDGGMAYLRRVGAIRQYTEMSIELPDAACRFAIEAADEALGLGEHPVTGGHAVVLGCAILTRLGIHGVHCEGPLPLAKHIIDACQWAIDTNRNGLGALCAVARAVRDNGGVWVTGDE